MTIDVAAQTTPTYCQPSDVGFILQKAVPSASASEGDPSLAYWQDVIMAKEDEIDRLAKTSWRTRTVTQEVPFDGLGVMPDPEGFILVPLRRRDIVAFSSAAGDKIEVWNGSQYDDWVATHTQGRQGDWYLNAEAGQLHLRTRVLYGNAQDRMRITYRYGQTVVPRNIKRATALLAAAELAVGQVESQHGSGSGLNQVSQDRRVEQWLDEANRILTAYVAVEGL